MTARYSETRTVETRPRDEYLEVRSDGDRWYFEVWDHLGEVLVYGWRGTYHAALTEARRWR